MARRSGTLSHIFPRNVTSSIAFTPPKPRRNPNLPHAFPYRPDPANHARRLLGDLAAAGSTAAGLDDTRREALLDDAAGMFIDVEFVPNADFSLKSLEDARAGIELVTVTEISIQRAQATLFVP